MPKTYTPRKVDRGGSPAQEAALELQLRGLRDLEQTEVYQALCAEATERRRAEDALPRQQNGKLLARALAAPSSASVPPSASGGGTGGAQDRQLGKKCESGSAQAPPTSEARP